MFKPTYLYIKTHNKTGLKYFGKTCKKDPHKYTGSGVEWNDHCRNHGYDYSTEIVGYYTDETECREVAIKFSEENKIVESSEWANRKIEILDGGWDHINNDSEKRISKNKRARESTDKILEERWGSNWRSELGKLGSMSAQSESAKLKSKQTKKERGIIPDASRMNTPEVNLKRIEKFKEINHQQGAKNSQFGTMWITDGTNSKKIEVGEEIPNGWVKGRVIKKHSASS